MVFLRSISASESPVLHTSRVMLRAPANADFGQWSALRGESRSFLTPWEPIWAVDELSKSAFRRRIRRAHRQIRKGTGYPFLVLSADGETLLGGLTLAHIERGVSQSGVIGYWMGERYAGRGFMSSAVRAVINHSFETLRLNRLEASCLPHNAASIRLLEKVGFTREGYARRYLFIDGRWQDHLRFGMVRDDPRL